MYFLCFVKIVQMCRKRVYFLFTNSSYQHLSFYAKIYLLFKTYNE
ncbi:hypothetical protein HMPREF9151_01243 [Hoylesella saccharolytica F0055]|uniref:Uncharacterized protein n=1 Tax=Hoylesella saccharolytica F0055 TaxID=1127699 RepID=L1NBH6_9BACT|nr:hypothetical protein HMPREF9151_01243 [Hoylesella saccharolytica F0055]